jgi:YVTN family beta-propeller protein
LDYKLNNGLGNYTLTGSSLTTPQDTFTCTLTSPNFFCSDAAIAGTTSPATLTFVGADAGNASTPGNTKTDNSQTLPIVPEMTVTPPSTAPVTAVTGRRYGTGAGCSGGACVALDYKLNNGLGNYTLTGSSLTTPQDTFTCTLTSPNFYCSDAAIAGTASPATLAFVGAETGNISTPGNTKTDTSQSLSIVPEMTVTAPTPAPAVTGRRYGTGTGCSGGSCVALDYKLNNGLGNYTLTGSSLTTPQDTFACTLTSPNFYCSDAAIAGTTSPATLTFAGAETGNASTPGNTKNDTSQSLTITPELTVTPPSPAPVTAVTGRRYGTGAGCSGGNCVALDYKLNNGLGNYTLTGSSLTTPQDAFTCTLTSPNFFCSDAAIVGTTSPATLTFVGADAGNASTPGNTKTDTSQTLAIVPEMTVTPPSPAPVTAVTGRRYGTGAGCSGGSCVALNYKLNNGLGNYTLTGSSLTTAQDAFTCTLTSPNYFCSDGTILGTTTPATLTFVGAETGNASTPGNTKTDTSQTLAIVPELTVTPPASVAAAVTGRRYGTGAGCSGGSCVALNYKLNNGLGNYTLTGTSLTTPQDTFICTLTSPNFFCSDGAIAGTTTPATLTFIGAETGDISTPGNTKTDTSQSLTINAVLTVNNPTPFPVPAAVTGRLYGSGSGCSAGSCVPLAYNPSGGITPYTTITGSGFPAPITCAQSSNTLNCSASTGITGSTATGTINVTDSSNAATPSGTTSRSSDSVTVDPALAITNTVLPNGLLGFEYNPSGPGVTLTTTGGLGTTLTWVGPGATAGACSTAPTGTLDPDLTLSSAGLLSSDDNALTTLSTAATQWTFQVCVSDTGNATTPAGFALPATTGNDFVVNVMDTLAYVAENSANKVAIINTTSNTAGTPLSTNISTPDSVAISPNGRLAYVTMGNNKIAVVDTITQGHFGNSPFALPAGCVAPTGIAITPDGTQFYVACPGGNEVLVFSAITATTTSPLTALATISTGAGSTPDSVAFKPDGTRAYVTLSGNNKLAIINTSTQAQITSSPFTLSAINTGPLGIALATNGSEIYAYIAKNAAGSGQPGVEVEDITSDPSTSPLTPVANIQTGASSAPDSVAVLPDSSRVYAALEGANQFAVIDNTVATPAQITGSPYNLPDPAFAATASAPLGVTSPPLSSVPVGGYRVYLCLSNAAQSNVAVMDDLGNTTTTPHTPAEDSASPVVIDASATPTGIEHIPVPK